MMHINLDMIIVKEVTNGLSGVREIMFSTPIIGKINNVAIFRIAVVKIPEMQPSRIVFSSN